MPRVDESGIEWDTTEKATAESIEEATKLVMDRLHRTVPDADHALELIDQRGQVYQFRAVHRWRLTV